MPPYDLAKNVSDAKFYSKYFNDDKPMRTDPTLWHRKLRGSEKKSKFVKTYTTDTEFPVTRKGKGVERGIWTFRNPEKVDHVVNELNNG